MKIKYSPESIADLNRLVEFIEAKNPYAARRIAIDMQEAFDNLKRFPKMGLPVLKSHDPELIRDLYINHYVARYLISDDVIYILRIWRVGGFLKIRTSCVSSISIFNQLTG